MMALSMNPPAGPDAARAVAVSGAAGADAARDEIDESTLARCRTRDPMACRAFVVRYERAVFALLSRLVGAGSHVEDLAQETFLRAFRALPDFHADAAPAEKTRAKPSTWLLTIATRVALDAKKRRTVPTAQLEAAAASAGLAATPEVESGRRELGRAIARAAAELSDEQRAAFVLADFHGLAMHEIAEALGIPEGTAKTRLFRAREHMRERLGAHWRER
jgi:RNA polymerase sigma-70 factor (ECF subfamily)